MPLTPLDELAPLSLKEMVQAEKAKRSLYEFAKQAWPILEPSTTFCPGWHLEAIADHLEACSEGHIQNLLINVPPRHMKSLMSTVFWPAWSWIAHPERRWLCSSYALSLAVRDSRKSKILIESDWFRRRWGHVFQISADQSAKMRYENNHSGYRLSVSTESAATGEGGDVVLVDDPHNVRDSYSQIKRESTLLWWDVTMSTRLNNARTGVKVIIMQRVHEEDLSGHVLEQGSYIHLCLPAEYDPARRCFTSIGWEDPRQKEGELLWPKQMGVKEIDKMKISLGAFGYAAQYQQTPVPMGGAIFKQDYLRYYRIDDQFFALFAQTGEMKRVLRSTCWIFATVDLAASQKSTADYTVISTWAVTPDNELLLLDQIRERLTGPEIQEYISACYYRFGHRFLAIEAVAFQMTMVQQLLHRGIPVQEYRPMKDKVSRAISASVFYAGGMIYHLQGAPYLHIFETELLNFPKAKNDDTVDTVSMATEIAFLPKQPNIRSLDDEDEFEEILHKHMERGGEWGDI